MIKSKSPVLLWILLLGFFLIFILKISKRLRVPDTAQLGIAAGYAISIAMVAFIDEPVMIAVAVMLCFIGLITGGAVDKYKKRPRPRKSKKRRK